MNKIFKVIWNEARNAYVVVSEIAKNHGSKSCSTKKLLAMLIATGVMTCAGMAPAMAQLVAVKTNDFQYVALKAAAFAEGEPTIWNRDSWNKDFTSLKDAKTEWNAQRKDGQKPLGDYTYKYDAKNGYWVRAGYVLTVDENGGKYTQLSDNAIRADVAYTGTGVPGGILQSVTSTVARNGVVTHSGDSLQKVTAGSYAGVSNSGGTEVAGSWNYIINDSSWENSGAEYKDGYVDLVDLKGDKMPRGFKTTDSGLNWDEVKQTYTYQGKAVDYRNMYVIDGRLGVFTNYDGSEVYTGTVYGKHNEILMTVKDNGKFYSYWAASVTDPSATMETYPVSKYNSDLAVIDQNIKDLNKDIIKEVTLTKDTNSAIIRLIRNGGKAVDGAITVTSGGGTDGKDTFVKISNAADTEGKTFATGSKVEAIVDNNGATTGIKINGEDYTIKSGSKVSVTQNAAEKTTTITVDGKATTITDTDTHNELKSASLSGKTLTITGKDNDSVNVDLSSIDTDTTYTAGNGIAIDKTNKNAISVKLKEDEKNLEVTEAGLELKKDLTVNRVEAGDFYMSTAGIGYGDKAYITSSGLNANSQKITGVAAGTISEGSTDAVNGSQLNATNKKVDELNAKAGKHTTLVAGDNVTLVEKETDKGLEYTVTAKDTTYSAGDNVAIDKDNKISVDLSKYAKTEDVAVVYDQNKTSLRSTNATVKENAIALGKGASAVKNSIAIGNGAYTQDGTLTRGQSVALGNGAVTGAKSTSIGSNAVGGREGTITIGANANNGSLYATVIGTDSKVNYMTRNSGAAATIVGAKSEIKNDNKSYSGVANGIFGSANTIENSNGVTIQGSGNTVTNAYKNMSGWDFNLGGVYVKKDAGAVGVIGGMNTVSNQIYTNVIGFGNTVAGDADNISHDVFVAGSRNNLSKVSDSIVMGNDNTISDRSNVISFGHQNTISASNAVAIGNGASVSVEGGVALGVGSVADRANAVSVGSTGANRQIINVAAGEADTDAVNVSQLNAVKETANKGWNLSTNGGEASKVAPDATVDFSGDKNISVSHDGTKVQVELNKNIDVNSIQTNALNAKYNLSVGTMAENGIMPFLVNSTGAFYAANNNFSVDKDGKVIATAGEIGNVVLQNGVYTGNSVLRDGELYVGDASGNYSQITTTGAKLGQVTIAADGKISGVAAGEVSSTSTDAINGSQLHAVATEAGKHTTLSNGKNTTVESTVKDGQTDYKVNVAGDLTDITSVANGDSKINLNKDSIIISNGNKYFAITNSGIGMSYIGADYSAKSIMLGENGTTISGGLNVAGSKITGVAEGEVSSTSTDAVNGSQLHAVATEAGKHTTLSNGKNTTVESTVKDGQTDYKVNVAGDLTDITSVANGDSKINLNKDSIIISNGNKYFAITNSGIGMSYIGADYSAKSIMLGENGTTISGGLNVAGSKITGVAEGVADTDAVNVGQLKEAVQAGNTDTHIKPGEYGVGADNKVNMDVVDKNGNKVDTVTIKDVAKASDVGDVNNIASDIKNQDGSHTTVVDAVNNLNNKLDNKVGDLNYVEGGKGNYVTNGENTTTSIGKLDQALKDVAATAAKHTTVTQGVNITVTKSDEPNENGGENYNVALNKDIELDSVTTGQTVMNNDGVKVGTDVSLNKDGLKVGDKVSVSATAVTAGKTSISDEGVKVGDKTYINDKGLNANGQNITNVADGKVEKDSKDAINGGQLHQAKADINNRIDGVENQVVNNTNRINKLGSRVNKVGAGAAALAALHPMDFDPDDKLTFSAGYGNYGGENAAAIGAYYRPDEKVMFSVAGTVGNGENMVNAGVSFALDRTNHVSNSRTALAREVIDLRGQLAVMGAKMAKMEKAFGMLDETKTKLFPDVPANHWAYEYIAKLAGNGYIEGYPDGNFGGDRLMTRYEFAAMLYRAIEKGAALEEKIIKEFEPELGRIRVDRISGEDGDRDKIERVRVNDTKGERDHYGNKLAK